MANKPFFFAWIASGTVAFNPAVHNVEDEKVFAFEIEHSEGDFASLALDVKNPRRGLLAPGEPVWAWLSWQRGIGDIVPLFKGRLVGVPENISNDIVRLLFIARPPDYNSLKAALAQTLRVPPSFDPAWIAEAKWEDDDAVLEARAQLYHVDRVTHAVTVSDVITGEDGTLTFETDESMWDSVGVSYGETPLRKVHVLATARWVQSAAGTLDLTGPVNRLSGSGLPYAGVSSFTGDGLQNDWPRPNAAIGGGWSVLDATIERVDGVTRPTRYQKFPFFVNNTNDAGVIISQTEFVAWFPLWEFVATLNVQYTTNRERTETLEFTIESDVQALLTEPGEAEELQLVLTSNDLSIPSRGETPIIDVKRRAYFPTDRGHESIDYLIALARSRLLIRARAVEVKWDVKFEEAVDFTCRKNAVLIDERLPGGQAGGKITSYGLFVDGDTGSLNATVTIGCCIGNGGTVTTVPGTPTYVDEGYVEPGYQMYEGQSFMPFAGEITYTLPTVAIGDDGIDFNDVRYETAVQSLSVTGTPEEQRTAIQALQGLAFAAETKAYERVLEDVYTEYTLVLKPVTGGPFLTEYAATLSQLKVPQTIDLEAPSSP